MGGVSPKGPAHSPLSSQTEKPLLSVNNIQEKMALGDAIYGEPLWAVTEAVCVGGGEGAIVALNSQPLLRSCCLGLLIYSTWHGGSCQDPLVPSGWLPLPIRKNLALMRVWTTKLLPVADSRDNRERCIRLQRCRYLFFHPSISTPHSLCP